MTMLLEGADVERAKRYARLEHLALGLPPPLMKNWQWQQDARCLGYPIEVFFPDDVRGQHLRRREQRAKAICRDCPVRPACLRHALSVPEFHGIWGATTAGERTEVLGRGGRTATRRADDGRDQCGDA